MELFFDTYTDKNGVDVRNYTDQVTNLMQFNADLHPRLLTPGMELRIPPLA